MTGHAPIAGLLVLDARPELHDHYRDWLAGLAVVPAFASSNGNHKNLVISHPLAGIAIHVDAADEIEPHLEGVLPDYPGVPVIFVTPVIPTDLPAVFRSAGLFDFLISPVVPALMRTKVRFILELRRVQAEGNKLERERDSLAALVGEHVHRGKNLLAIMQSISLRTVNDGREIAQSRTVLLGRLRAIARAYESVTSAGHSGVELGDMVEIELGESFHRAVVSGPSVRLRRSIVQTVTLALHELTTNSLRHGALGAPEGTVSVGWTFFDCNEERYLEVDWSEHGGPDAVVPKRAGFGLSLVGSLAGPGGGSPNYSFDAPGFTCRMRLPQDTIAID